MTVRASRRAFLAGAAAWLAAPAVRAAAEAEPVAAILARSGLGAFTGFALVEVATGRPIEGHRADVGLPPASVAKILTALYALEALGPGYRFRTRVLGNGPIVAGVLQGDLVLEGGGDPVLDTDALGGLAQALAARGLTGATGFGVAAGALPAVERIADDQPEEAGYNPAIAGLNLNFNRVRADLGAGRGGAGARVRARRAGSSGRRSAGCGRSWPTAGCRGTGWRTAARSGRCRGSGCAAGAASGCRCARPAPTRARCSGRWRWAPA